MFMVFSCVKHEASVYVHTDITAGSVRWSYWLSLHHLLTVNLFIYFFAQFGSVMTAGVCASSSSETACQSGSAVSTVTSFTWDVSAGGTALGTC